VDESISELARRTVNIGEEILIFHGAHAEQDSIRVPVQDPVTQPAELFKLACVCVCFQARKRVDAGLALIHRNLPGVTEVGNVYILRLDLDAFGEGLATGKKGDVMQHTFTLISEAARHYGRQPAGGHAACARREQPAPHLEHPLRLSATACRSL
jgi:hypothetical protein